MLFREDLAEEKNPFLEWPKHFYEERVPEKEKRLFWKK